MSRCVCIQRALVQFAENSRKASQTALALVSSICIAETVDGALDGVYVWTFSIRQFITFKISLDGSGMDVLLSRHLIASLNLGGTVAYKQNFHRQALCFSGCFGFISNYLSLLLTYDAKLPHVSLSSPLWVSHALTWKCQYYLTPKHLALKFSFKLQSTTSFFFTWMGNISTIARMSLLMSSWRKTRTPLAVDLDTAVRFVYQLFWLVS